MKKLITLILSVALCVTFISPNTAEAAVKISKAKATMEVDSTLKLKVSGTKSKITWKTSKKTIATVNSSGIVTAKSAGQATITATVGNKKYTCKITVVDSNTTVDYADWVLYETDDLELLVKNILAGNVVEIDGQLYCSLEYAEMISDAEVVYYKDVAEREYIEEHSNLNPDTEYIIIDDTKTDNDDELQSRINDLLKNNKAASGD